MKRLEKIKKEFIKLYDLKYDKKKYDMTIDELCDKLKKLNMPDLIDPFHVKFLFRIQIGNKIARTTHEEFIKFVEDSFKNVESIYYFHKPELYEFPNYMSLGHGRLINYDSLPFEVNELANKIFSGESPFKDSLIAKAFVWHLHDNIAISDPNKGSWLEIKTSSISYNIRYKKAFEKAEESLDVLRLVETPYRLNSIQYAIVFNEYEKSAFPASVPLSGIRYDYDQTIKESISRYSSICVNPKNDIENRIKNSLYFKRIGDNFAPDHLRIFYYVAAIEKLILGTEDRDARWKFSQKGAILLDNDSIRRQKISKELKDMYDLRSGIAHGGKSEYDFSKTIGARNYLHSIIRKLVYLIDKEKIEKVSRDSKKEGVSLDEYIDKIIFSG